jgi:uncharacterized protein CbrC (UPF0167 family)
MDLPVFRYHPDPLASGSIAASDAQCACCGQRRGFIYTGPAYCEEELEDALCPWCIADGSAHKKFDASFASEFADGIPPGAVDEITYRTPGFNSWQQDQWLGCCGDAAAFLEGQLMMYIVHELGISGAAATRFLHGLQRDHGATAYIFGCRHCDAKPAYIDFV